MVDIYADRVLGKGQVTVDGEVLRTEAGIELILAGDELKEIEGDYETGYTSSFKAAQLTCKLMVKQGDSVSRWLNAKDNTLIVEYDTGQRYILSNARQNNRPKITGKDGGSVELKWTSTRCEEILS